MATTTPPLPPPPQPPLAAQPPAKGPAPPWLKILIGCGIGCGVLVLIAIGVAIYAAWWVLSPGDQVATESVVGDDSVAVVHLTGDRAVTGLSELIGHLFSEMQRLQSERNRGQLPEPLRWLEGMQQMQQRQATAQGMGMWVPRELTVSMVEGDEPGDYGFVVACNMRQLVRPFRAFMLGIAEADSSAGGTAYHRHGDHKIVELNEDVALCFYGGTALFSDSVDTMRRALDQIDATGDQPPQLDKRFAEYEQLKERWALIGVFDRAGSNDDAPADRLATDLAGEQSELEELLRRADRISFGVEISSADAVHGELTISMADAADLALLSAAARTRLQEIEQDLGDRGMTLEHQLTKHDGSLLVNAEVTGLAAVITRWLEEQIESSS